MEIPCHECRAGETKCHGIFTDKNNAEQFLKTYEATHEKNYSSNEYEVVEVS